MKTTKSANGFKRWEIKITLDISDTWVETGFDMGDLEQIAELQEKIQEILPYALGGEEIKAKLEVLAAPLKKEIKDLQG